MLYNFLYLINSNYYSDYLRLAIRLRQYNLPWLSNQIITSDYWTVCSSTQPQAQTYASFDRPCGEDDLHVRNVLKLLRLLQHCLGRYVGMRCAIQCPWIKVFVVDQTYSGVEVDLYQMTYSSGSVASIHSLKVAGSESGAEWSRCIRTSCAALAWHNPSA